MNAHNSEVWELHEGDIVDCNECAIEAQAIEALRQNASKIFRSRYRYNAYYFYKRDYDSPSGVTLLCSAPVSPKVEEVLKELKISPLSPTEGF